MYVCDLWVSRPFEALPRFTSDLYEPQGLCCSRQGSYPFQKAVDTPLCLPSLPDITDLNDLWDTTCVYTQQVKANLCQPHKQAEGEIFRLARSQVGCRANSSPPDGTSFNLFIAAPVRFVQGVSEKGKIPTAELKNGM